MQLKVKLLAFGERQPATLIVVDGVPSLVVYRHVYHPGELPARSKIIAPRSEEIPPDDRAAGARLIEAARREGFIVVVDVGQESEHTLDAAV